MKIFKINILLLLVFFQAAVYGQSEKNMINNSITIPLKIGQNPSIQFESLVIEPANLYMQSKPRNKSFAQVQLELIINENTSSYTTFLRNYDGSSHQKTNYPKAYLNYSFTLKINKEEVALVVTKLDFGKAMFIDLGKTAMIGNLSIQFIDCVGEWSTDIHGNQTDAFNTYTLLLSEENEQQIKSFISRDKQVKKELLIAWKDYKISILEDSEKSVQLLVLKNESK